MQALRKWSSGSWMRKVVAVLANALAWVAVVFAAMLAYTLIFETDSLAEIVGRAWYMIVPAAVVTSLLLIEASPNKKPGKAALWLSWIAVVVLAAAAALLTAQDGCTLEQRLVWIAVCIAAVMLCALLDKLIEGIFKE